MPRYHIQVRTESHVKTAVEIERDDLTALRIELAQFVGELLRDHAEQIWVDEEWRIDVTDDRGLILYVMELQASDSASTMVYSRRS